MTDYAVDSHAHVFDPARFGFNDNSATYAPHPKEIGTPQQFVAVLDAHGMSHGLLVNPMGGYGTDNRCMLDAIATSQGRLKGVAVKLSGAFRWSHESWPHADGDPYVQALIAAFGLDNCVWGSDWPFVRIDKRIDYGPLRGWSIAGCRMRPTGARYCGKPRSAGSVSSRCKNWN